MSDVFIVVCFALVMVMLQFYSASRHMKLVDRLSDKLMATNSPQSFATYATSTPTAKEEYSFRHPNGNGKVSIGASDGYDLPPNMEII